MMIERELSISIRITDDGRITTTIVEPQSGLITSLYNEYSPDEHPEFDERLGNEIYSWISLWVDEITEQN